MSRIRTVKPEFWTSEQIVECSTSARLLFVGMWNFCDDAGVHPDSAKRVKMEVFPGDDLTSKDVMNMIDELVDAGLLIRYEAHDGRCYLAVAGWHHQKIERHTFKYPRPKELRRFDKEFPSKHRDLDERSTIHSTTIRRTIDEPSPPEGKGREGKGKERKTLGQTQDSFDRDFEKFWDEVPRKVAKGAARKAFKVACKRASAETITAGMTAYAASVAETEERFIRHPATWLNGESWPDNAPPGGNGADLDFPGFLTRDEQMWAARLRGWRGQGFWLDLWGPKPGEPECQVPASILASAAETADESRRQA